MAQLRRHGVFNSGWNRHGKATVQAVLGDGSKRLRLSDMPKTDDRATYKHAARRTESAISILSSMQEIKTNDLQGSAMTETDEEMEATWDAIELIIRFCHTLERKSNSKLRYPSGRGGVGESPKRRRNWGEDSGERFHSPIPSLPTSPTAMNTTGDQT